MPVNQQISLITLTHPMHLPYMNSELIAALFCSSMITGTSLTEGTCARNPKRFYLPPDYDVFLCGKYS